MAWWWCWWFMFLNISLFALTSANRMRVCVDEDLDRLICHTFKTSNSENRFTINITNNIKSQIYFDRSSTIEDVIENIDKSYLSEAFKPILTNKPLLRYIYKTIRYINNLNDVVKKLCQTINFIFYKENAYISLIGEPSISQLNIFINQADCGRQYTFSNSIIKTSINRTDVRANLQSLVSSPEEKQIEDLFRIKNVSKINAPNSAELFYSSIFTQLTECFHYYGLYLQWSFYQMKQHMLQPKFPLGKNIYNCLYIVPFSNEAITNTSSREISRCLSDRVKRSPPVIDAFVKLNLDIIDDAIKRIGDKSWGHLKLERDDNFLIQIRSSISDLPLQYQQSFLKFFKARLIILKKVLENVDVAKTITNELQCIAENKKCLIKTNNAKSVLAGVSYLQGGLNVVPKLQNANTANLIQIFISAIHKHELLHSTLFSLFSRFFPHENMPVTYIIYKRLDNNYRFFLYALLQDPFIIISLLDKLYQSKG